MKMFVGGAWRDGSRQIEVSNPFDDSGIDTVPHGNADDVKTALATLEAGAAEMRAMPAFERSQMLTRVSRLMLEHAEALAHAGLLRHRRMPGCLGIGACRATEASAHAKASRYCCVPSH